MAEFKQWTKVTQWTKSFFESAGFHRLLVWLLFSLVISLMPFFLKTICMKYLSRTVSLNMLFGSGELFLVTAVIAAETIGDMFASLRLVSVSSRWLFIGGSSVISAFVATFGYGLASIGPQLTSNQITIDESVMTSLSITFFSITCIGAILTKFGLPVQQGNSSTT
jgi:hypothetical protein